MGSQFLGRMLASAVAVCAAIPVVSGQARPPESPPTAQSAQLDWFAIDRAVVDMLMSRDLAGVMRSLPSPESTTDPATLLRSLDYLTRAGRRVEARVAIDRLSKIAVAPTEALSQVGDFLIGREDWDLARVFLERFPDAVPGWGYVFVRHWAERGDPGEIDRWLDARSASGRQYWFDERLRFRASLGTVDRLIDSLAIDLRNHPADILKAKRYVAAVRNHAPATSLDWVGTVATPPLAYDSYELGVDLLSGAHAPRAAAQLFERSLSRAYTGEDQRRLDAQARMSAAYAGVRPASWEETLRRSTTIALIDAYTKSGQAARAQPLIEKLAALGASGGPVFELSQLAGTVQRETGQRVIEQRITAAEDDNRNSVDYWRSRAQYYTGRRDRRQTIAAYERALALATPDRVGPVDRLMERYHVVGDFARWLDQPNDSADARTAIALIWREFSAAEPGSEYASWLAGDIARRSNDNERLVSMLPDAMAEQRLWAHIAARAAWGPTEQLLIRRLIEHLAAGERRERVARAESLTTNTDPSRASVLADVLIAIDARRAIALLQSYIDRVPNGHDRDLAKLRLFSAYLNQTTDWRAAEDAFPGARGLLTPAEVSDHLGRLALLAAKAGAADDALRLWRLTANVDRADLRHLRAVAAEPAMRRRLVGFYDELARTEPNSWVPEAALGTLRKP